MPHERVEGTGQAPDRWPRRTNGEFAMWCQMTTDAAFPERLKPWFAAHGRAGVFGIGHPTILKRPILGLICSVQVPGSIVMKTFDAIRELRDAGVVIAGGFHSPMERECLDFLLRGTQPVVVVLAKSLSRPRFPSAWRSAIDAGRLLVLSPFEPDAKRTSRANAQARNDLVSRLATAVLIPHASPGGKAEALARVIVDRGQSLFTFEDEENDQLTQLGATSFSLEQFTHSVSSEVAR
jgi:predicted Rossmann fold nucleotide-binding protein DprA/Smf involved in DNA uptake